MSLRALLPLTLKRCASRSVVLMALLLGSAGSVSSCLTPDINYEPPASAGGSGSAGDSGSGGTENDECSNQQIDEGETDLNCGGMLCPKCRVGMKCEIADDCENEACTAGECKDPNCDNDARGETETDVDCGGGECEPCADGKRCKVDSDCTSNACFDTRCAAPTCTDRRKNQGELDIDCGGPCGPCDLGQACILDIDCIQPASGPGEISCDDQVCVIHCPQGTDHCNDKSSDGCEIDLTDDVNHCGGCDIECDLANAVSSVCSSSKCVIDGGCLDGFEDCNDKDSDGCEIDLNTDTAHCGTCDIACSANNGTPSCEDGDCSIACEPTYSDCDGNPTTNGCEFADDDIGTVENCLACGDVCTGTNPFCDGASGCKQSLPATVVDSWIGQATSAGTVTLNVSLTNGPGTNRALVVLVAASKNVVVRMGATDMTTLIAQTAEDVGYASIHYLFDASLGPVGAKTITVTADWGGKVVAALELINVPQVAPSGAKLSAVVPPDCPTNVTTPATVTSRDSLVVGSLLARYTSSVPATLSGFDQQLIGLWQGEQTNGFLAYREGLDQNATVGWTDVGLGGSCYAIAMVTATFDSIVTGPP